MERGFTVSSPCGRGAILALAAAPRPARRPTPRPNYSCSRNMSKADASRSAPSANARSQARSQLARPPAGGAHRPRWAEASKARRGFMASPPCGRGTILERARMGRGLWCRRHAGGERSSSGHAWAGGLWFRRHAEGARLSCRHARDGSLWFRRHAGEARSSSGHA